MFCSAVLGKRIARARSLCLEVFFLKAAYSAKNEKGEERAWCEAATGCLHIFV